MIKEIIIIIISNFIIISFGLQCSLPNDNYRLDCFPESNANQRDCLTRGCCWIPPNIHSKQKDPISVPYCFYPTDYPNYQTKFIIPTKEGFKSTLFKNTKSFLPNEISYLNLEVIYETNSRIRLRITDPNVTRFEVPINISKSDPIPPSDPDYRVIISSNSSFSLEIKRNSDGLSLFKSYGPLLYSDQFIQISSFMAVDQVYGIGEQNRPFLHSLSEEWERIGLWARDNAIETYNNLYGTHPFYMGMPDNGKAFGIFYFNSNAQEFVLQPAPIITYRTTGGILDIFIFTGGTPESTVKQYTSLIGKPMLPPYWSLGFHLCRWGYQNVNNISKVLLRNLNASIPIDVQWSDIDYMDEHKDFTLDQVNYKDLGNFVKAIRKKLGIRYIVIIDPAIAIENPGSYLPYDDGVQMGIYIRDSVTKKPLIGKVWPGDTVYPDFTHPNVTNYWSKQIQRFYNLTQVDGLWIDMNEPSNFYDGSISGCPNNSRFDKPFFIPTIRDNSLIIKTICSSALHYNDVLHYNLHNLYGYTEAIATHQALLKTIPNKRPFILSRSTFSGSGKYTFHWTGDNNANWDQLANSIRQLLNFNMFGIPMVGADICGFGGNSNEELCIRWMQLGAFYPFMRNHNTIGASDQDPASWSVKAQGFMRTILNIRYSLLPNFYTLLVKSHLTGGTVMRPMSFEFYTDYVTHSLDLQFMIGSAMLISPVVTQGATSVLTYFPAGVWYDLMNFNIFHSGDSGKWINLETPLNKINIALQGGQIITLLQPGMNTDLSRKSKFSLFCALSISKIATGDLFWDDGESLDSYTMNKYSYLQFSANATALWINVLKQGFTDIPYLQTVIILGLNQTDINTVTINEKPISFDFNNKDGILEVFTDNLILSTNYTILWS